VNYARLTRLGFCLLLVTAIAAATTIIPMSVEKLTQSSSHVLEGAAIGTWSQWNAQHNLIYTYTKFQVSSAWKGQAPKVVVVKQPGGIVGNTKEKVYGVRYLRPGVHSVLFLRPSDERDGTLIITGLVQGNFRVRISPTGQEMVSNGVPEVSSYSVSNREVSSFEGNRMRLAELKARVVKAAQQ
jgi:hypothetical protein